MIERSETSGPETAPAPETQARRERSLRRLLPLHRKGPGTIRARLLLVFVLIGLLPAVAISIGSILAGRSIGQRRAVAHLESGCPS